MFEQTVVVEFFGLPGSGKTTLSNIINQRLINDGFDVTHRVELMRWVQKRPILFKASGALSNPMWIIHFFNHLKLFSGKNVLTDLSFLNKIVKTVNNLIYLDSFLKKRKPDVLLLDQWSVQNIWSNWIGLKEPGQNNLFKNVIYTEKLYKKKYIYFSIEPKVAAMRIVTRTGGISRFDELDFNTIKDMLFSEHKLMNNLLNAIKCQNSDMLLLDSIKSSEINLEIVLDWLKPYLAKK